MKIVEYNEMIDDYTFGDYYYDDFNFLNCFNENVQNCLIKKIKADTNKIIKYEQKYNPVESLDDLIDILIFIHNPPDFLMSPDIEYHDNYNRLMIEYANKFN